MSTDPLLDGNRMEICVRSVANLVNFMDVYFGYRDLKVAV